MERERERERGASLLYACGMGFFVLYRGLFKFCMLPIDENTSCIKTTECKQCIELFYLRVLFLISILLYTIVAVYWFKNIKGLEKKNH